MPEMNKSSLIRCFKPCMKHNDCETILGMKHIYHLNKLDMNGLLTLFSQKKTLTLEQSNHLNNASMNSKTAANSHLVNNASMNHKTRARCPRESGDQRDSSLFRSDRDYSRSSALASTSGNRGERSSPSQIFALKA